MGTVIASYLVRVTLRDPSDRDAVGQEALPEPPEPPTNDVLAGVIGDEIHRKFDWAFAAVVTSERTDR